LVQLQHPCLSDRCFIGEFSGVENIFEPLAYAGQLALRGVFEGSIAIVGPENQTKL
jgi:hypothetical protein